MKFMLPAALLMAAGLAGGAAAGEGDLASRVDKTVQAWQPVNAERCLDDIGWARDLRDALRLATENNRPVFLFTYSGSAVHEHAIAGQRC